MAKKSITFEIHADAFVNQTFDIPENYDMNGKSPVELYDDIINKYGCVLDSNVLDEDICVFEFEVESLRCIGFSGYHIERDGMTIQFVKLTQC